MNKSKLIVITIFTAISLLIPHHAPADESFKVLMGDSGIGESRITASFRGTSGLGADIYLQPCSSAIKTDCIQSLYFLNNESDNWTELQVDEKINYPELGVPRFGASPDVIVERLSAYPEDTIMNLPAGGMSPVYKDASAKIDSGIRYLVQVRAQGSSNSGAPYKWNDLRLEIKPVKVASYTQLNIFGFPTLQLLPNFSQVKSFKITLRSKATKNLFSGWFYGRILQPELQSKVMNSGELTVELVGSPLATHIAQGVISFNDYALIQQKSESALPEVRPGTSLISFGATYGFANGSGAMKVWRYLSPITQANAASNLSSFSIRTTKNSAVQTDYYPKGCQATDSLDGVVTTNAAMYNPSPPSYESRDSSLNFEVGSPHLDADGKVIQGIYSLVVSSKIATCIWGSDLSNSRATVSIINDSGQSQISTSTLKARNDFYYFHISGFTYSTKKISIRLDRIQESTPSPSATAIPKSNSPMMKITCVKGKLKKIVLGVKPICPKGYTAK